MTKPQMHWLKRVNTNVLTDIKKDDAAILLLFLGVSAMTVYLRIVLEKFAHTVRVDST